MYPLIDLSERTILIIGASQGIGRQTAITLSEVGARCILLARNEEKLQETLESLEGKGHAVKVLDVSDLESIEPCMKAIAAEYGPIDGLVYASGVTNDRPLNLLVPGVVDATMKTNLEGFLEAVRCVCKRNRFNPGMRIVGIASTAALAGTKAHTGYSASKAGMNGAVRCLAKELAEKDICINTVAPAMIRTAMYEKWYQDNGAESRPVRGLKVRQYLGVGEPVDIANAIAFLLSPAARYITGICLPIDGGSTTN